MSIIKEGKIAFEDLIWYNLQEINSICIKKNKLITNSLVYNSSYIELDGDYIIYYDELPIGYLKRINTEKYIKSLKNNNIDLTILRLYLN